MPGARSLAVLAPAALGLLIAGSAPSTPTPSEYPEAMSSSTGTDSHGGPLNRLAEESSPYLLLHRSNPVDWYPWGEEALTKAREEDKPIFLSVGYSTCYWCHVMERESFSDPEIAALLNEHFVPVKVDREERPDLDEIYMAATQILTGQGGWPNSVFLTPDLVPFFAGTYFPPRDTGGRPGFATMVRGLAEAWQGRRSQVEDSARQIRELMGRFLEQQLEPAAELPGEAPARAGYDSLRARYDERWGGFGGAPKFPTPSNLHLLLALLESDGEAPPEALPMLTATLAAMARGGLYDQLAGGFHRYSTDEKWLVPHFEKMLYDNGFLLEVYARHSVSGAEEGARAESERIVRETAAFLAREMTHPDGAFFSAIDAETEGEEGAYYVWSRAELDQILGKEAAAKLAPVYGFGGAPTFEGGRYVLHLPQGLSNPKAVAPARARLLEARGRRERPLTDDKVLTDWNGIAIRGLAEAGRLLEDPEMVAQAARAADFILAHLRPEDGALLHTWRDGTAKISAYLADYAFLVRGLLALHGATGEERWLVAARELTDEQIRRLGDSRGGFFVAAARDDLLFRSKDLFDGALPSPNAVAVLNLLDLAETTGEARFRTEAEKALKVFSPMLSKAPEGLRTLAIAAARLDSPTKGSPTLETPSGKDPWGGLRERAQSAVEARGILGATTEEGYRSFRVTLRIADPWHVNAHPASQEFLIPTALEAPGGELRQVVYPTGEPFRGDFAREAVQVYSGEVVITGELRGEPRLELTYQACDEEKCLPPVARTLELEERSEPETPAS